VNRRLCLNTHIRTALEEFEGLQDSPLGWAFPPRDTGRMFGEYPALPVTRPQSFEGCRARSQSRWKSCSTVANVPRGGFSV